MSTSTKKFPRWIIVVLAIVVFLTAIVPLGAAGIRFGVLPLYRWGLGIPEATATPEPTVVAAVPTVTPVPTATPVAVPTAAPVAQAPVAPVVVVTVPSVPTNPAIYASLNGKDYTDQGEYLNTYLGERVTFTCRKVVVPYKAWNETLNSSELKLVEDTWVQIKLDIPQGMTAVLFNYGIKQGIIACETGSLINLEAGHYEFSTRNGEIVIWYPSQDTYKDDDLKRIMLQIDNGNFDIPDELAIFGATPDMFAKLPAKFIKDKNVQIIPGLENNN